MKPSQAREILPGPGDLVDQIEKLGGKATEKQAEELLTWIANEWVSNELEEDDEEEEDDEDDDDLDEDFDDLDDDDPPEEDERTYRD